MPHIRNETAATADLAGLGAVTPYLVVPDAQALLHFLEDALGATELMRHTRPDGSIQHAEARVGTSVLMMGEPHPGGAPMPTTLHIVARDVDAAYASAIRAGAASLREPADPPQGGRMAGVQDPAGNHWYLASAP
jgi:PhnB protein